MRRRVRGMSLSGKLLLLTLVVAGAGIFSGVAILLVRHRGLIRDHVRSDTLALANSAAEYCVGPLVFDDPGGASEVLEKLRANDRIHAATLLDANGDVFATYPKHHPNVPELEGFEAGITTLDEYLVAVRPVQYEGKQIGTLAVASSTSQLEKELLREAVLTLLMSLGLLFLCGVLAFRLQKPVTAPLLRLAETMRGVTLRDGLPVLAHRPTGDEIGTLYDGFNTMIDKLEAREQERDRSESHLRAVLEALPDRVILVDREGRVYDPGEPAPPDEEQTSAGNRTLEDEVPMDVADALLAMVRETLDTGQRQRFEYAIEVDGGTRSFEAISSVVAGVEEEKAGLRVLVISRDVSTRRELERQLRQAAKMDAIGRLAGGVAHDFNNLLTGIIGYATLIRRLGDPRSELFAAEILGASDRASELVRQLLAFSRRSEPSLEPTRVESLVDSVASILRRTVDRRIVVHLDVEPCPTVRADPALLQSAILNLAVNARDAMPEGGDLTLRVRASDGTSSTGPDDGNPFKPEPHVEVSVIDTGNGIDPAVRNQIFDPFFTTKPTGQGTGLGLAAVYGTVKSHGGTVSVQSSVGKGTEFRIRLPAYGTPTSLPAAAPPRPSVHDGTGHILVVDDEDIVRQTLGRYLRELGYEVSEAIDGRDGLDLFEQEGEELDLVILDLVMPRMHGMDVLAVLRHRAPSLPVLLISGHATGPKVSEARRNADGFLQKPFLPADLLAKVQALLATPRRRALEPTEASVAGERAAPRSGSGRVGA